MLPAARGTCRRAESQEPCQSGSRLIHAQIDWAVRPSAGTARQNLPQCATCAATVAVISAVSLWRGNCSAVAGSFDATSLPRPDRSSDRRRERTRRRVAGCGRPSADDRLCAPDERGARARLHRDRTHGRAGATAFIGRSCRRAGATRIPNRGRAASAPDAKRTDRADDGAQFTRRRLGPAIETGPAGDSKSGSASDRERATFKWGGSAFNFGRRPRIKFGGRLSFRWDVGCGRGFDS